MVKLQECTADIATYCPCQMSDIEHLGLPTDYIKHWLSMRDRYLYYGRQVL